VMLSLIVSRPRCLYQLDWTRREV